MTQCDIKEEKVYLVIFGYIDTISYELSDTKGDFNLKKIMTNNEKPNSTDFVRPTDFTGKAYKTSFIGMTDNDEDSKIHDPEEENDIFKKMIYIALIVIPSIVIFLILIFIYCHRGYKIGKKEKDKLYNPKEEDKSLKFQSFSENGKSKKKNNHLSDSTTFRNDHSKISGLNSYSHSKSANTLYGNSMEQGNLYNENESASISSSFSEEPFGGKYISKKLDKPLNENAYPQANINIPYNNNSYTENSHSLISNRNSRNISRTMDEKSEDIVNTSIGHIEGEEFDNTKNIYIKINRSTNKYNTEEYLKEDSINKIKEKHSCITQLSHFFNENKDAASVNDCSSSSSSKINSNKTDSISNPDSSNNINNNSDNGTINSKKNKNKLLSNYLDKHIESIKSLENENEDEESFIEADFNNNNLDLLLPSLTQAQSRAQTHIPNSNTLNTFKSRNISTNTFGNSFSSDETETNPSSPLTPPHNPTITTSKSNNKGHILGRLIYTFYYSSSRILNVDEIVKIKKVYENNWARVERNPNEFFIIPLLVISTSFEDLRLFKMRCRKRRTKVDKEDMKINERVEPTPEYLYNCAYISGKDFQKMKHNVKWLNLIKSLDFTFTQTQYSMVTPSSSKPQSPTLPTTIHHSSQNLHPKKNIKVDLQQFMDSTSKNNSFQKHQINKDNVPDTTKKLNTSFKNSFLDRMDVSVSSSQDDIDIKDQFKVTNKEDEEFYHFENISDPGITN
ncbi:hypothetical protein BCR36DRAFT_585526 [Piromyces finnis]|uniref:Uncharacterized protein n=1 Tax=Piromyces finnis TaxID=1754191 RepID=A0A1Y1V2Q1_9FUNG|nr:hypothetical protein BCR36DRAFT_585526 [Piromyces finnis]|eukprot:ORX45765.1 hypothetical protein BCR36DRAFT_585526 [Piromyces finnis]